MPVVPPFAAALATAVVTVLAGSVLPAHAASSSAAAVRSTPPKSSVAPPVDYRVSFDSRARLGGHAAIRMQLQVDDREVASPAIDIQLFTPSGLDITSSDLGLETCRLPQASITNVLAGSASQQPCAANGLLGHGTATAMLRFTPDEVPIAGSANVHLYSGDTQRNRPGLTIFVAALNPVSTGLAYTGYLFNAKRPFGIGMKLQLPLIPSPPFGATVSLARLDMTIGARDIVYTERRRGKLVRYHPQGLGLPTRCPRAGFPFRVQLGFANGSRRTVTTRVRCPPRAKPA